MPTYDYRCKGCDAELEVVQAFTDDSLTTCEACGGELRKVFAAPGISFKGSGFYKTDSRNGSSSDAGSSDSKESKDSKDSKDSKPSADKADKKDATPKQDSKADKGGTTTKAPAAASSSS